MIRVERGPAPDFFSSKKYEVIRQELHSFFDDYTAQKRQSSFKGRGVDILRREVRADLVERFRGKCAYCESEIGPTASPDVDHFRPRRGARGLDSEGTKKGLYYDKHYWWLSLDWDNLLLACQECNRNKASWFPVEDESNRAEPLTSGDDLDAERPLLLDPCRDDPEGHLTFEADGNVTPLSRRGEVTIDILRLNRVQLRKARSRALDQLRERLASFSEDLGAKGRKPKRFRAIRDSLVDMLGEDSRLPYLAMLRQFLRSELERDPSARKDLSREIEKVGGDADALVESEPGGAEYESAGAELELGRLLLERIELHNFKNIEDLEIEVPQATKEGSAPWLLFLGENAVGKSSVLQAIALTLMGEQNLAATGVRPDDVLRYYREGGELKRAREGWVRIWVSGRSDAFELRFEDGVDEFESNVHAPGTYLLAYGSTRLLPEPDRPSPESEGRVRTRNLFHPLSPLIDVSQWIFGLWEADRDRHEEEDTPFNLIVRALRRMLLMKEDESIEPDLQALEKRRILIDLKNETTTLDNLSDGYRTILALASDMMYMLHREGTSMSEAEGIVIVDEMGTNLHPGWKKRIASCLRDVFPRIQFIVTTHEPLCLRGLNEGETVLLRRDYDEKVVAVTELPNPAELRVDELLASEFFGLSSTLDPDVEEIYEEYYKLLNVRRPTATQKKRIAELKEQLREREHLGHGLRDELMYDVIDKLLAEQLRSAKPKTRTRLKKEAVERVLESWRESGLYDDYMKGSES